MTESNFITFEFCIMRKRCYGLRNDHKIFIRVWIMHNVTVKVIFLTKHSSAVERYINYMSNPFEILEH